MFPHTRIRGIAAAVFASTLALSGAGCLNPQMNPFAPWPNPYPYGYPPPPGYAPAQPMADKSRPPIPDNSMPAGAPGYTGVVNAQYQQPVPPATAPQPPMPAPIAAPADPHTLPRPTATGAALNLGPNELPIDRAVELRRLVDAGRDENLMLQARVRSLEAKAEAREQALNEAVREVEAATLEVARTRVEFRAMRKDIETLRDRLKQVERDEVETLKAVIAALERLLRQPDDNP